MKKLLSITLALFLVLGLMSGMAVAEERSPYDMWKGDFVSYNTNNATYAGGEVIINHIRGQKSYMVNVRAYGLDPSKEYEAWLMTTAGFSSQIENIHIKLGDLTVDDYGFGRFFNNRIAAEELSDYLSNDRIRVVIYQLPRHQVVGY